LGLGRRSPNSLRKCRISSTPS